MDLLTMALRWTLCVTVANVTTLWLYLCLGYGLVTVRVDRETGVLWSELFLDVRIAVQSP